MPHLQSRSQESGKAADIDVRPHGWLVGLTVASTGSRNRENIRWYSVMRFSVVREPFFSCRFSPVQKVSFRECRGCLAKPRLWWGLLSRKRIG